MSIRAGYKREGVESFYVKHGDTYRNPHEPGIVAAVQSVCTSQRLDMCDVLDLACGSGEVTLALRQAGAGRIDGCDPYTGVAYMERTGQQAYPWSFADIAAGDVLRGRRYGLVVCSYALHLCEPSRLPGVLLSLAPRCNHLLLLSPHKQPVIKRGWGFRLVHEDYVERVRVRLYNGL